MDKRKQGLFEKYYVGRLDGKPMVSGCIVLEWQDKNARAGIKAFADAVRKDGYIVLADELEERLKAFAVCPYCGCEGNFCGYDIGGKRVCVACAETSVSVFEIDYGDAYTKLITETIGIDDLLLEDLEEEGDMRVVKIKTMTRLEIAKLPEFNG